MKVYVSCPIVVPMATLGLILKELNKNPDILAVAHARGSSYTTKNLQDSEAVIIVHPDNRFKFSVQTLPIGVLKEFNLAKELNKKVFICYFPQGSDTPGFYSTEFNNATLTGIPGTSASLFSMAEIFNSPEDCPIFNEVEVEQAISDVMLVIKHMTFEEKNSNKKALALLIS